MPSIKFSELSHFTDKQWNVTHIADTHKYTLYGGRRGPGKSYWLRWYPVRFLLKVAAEHNIRGARWGLFCEDYPSLKDRQITKIEKEFPEWLGTLKDSKTEGLAFHMHERYGGGIIALRNLDDPTKYKSSEFIGASIDELTQNKSVDVFNTLRGSLRWPGFEDTKLIAGSNPDGPGQKWVRELWIERAFPSELLPIAHKFAYVPAGPHDNPHLSQSYWEELNTLPEPLRRAWLDGDWYVTFEGLVYPEFNQDNITDQEPDPSLPIELAADDGYNDPRAILFIQRTGTQVLVFDELYHSGHLAETCVSEVLEKCQKHGWPVPVLCVGSPEAKEMQERFRRAGIPYRHMASKVLDGIDVVRRLIKDGQGVRTLKIHGRCKNTITEITSGYQYPKGSAHTNAEKPKDGQDHSADALRYWCYMRARRA